MFGNTFRAFSLVSWYLDEIVVYLVRTVVRLIREHRGKTWPAVKGKVEASYGPDSSLYPTAQLVYVYTVGAERYPGTHTRAFWSRYSAKDYAALFVAGSTLTVRYQPSQPETSIIYLEDQGELSTRARESIGE